MKKANCEEEERNSDDSSANDPESPSSADSQEGVCVCVYLLCMQF